MSVPLLNASQIAWKLEPWLQARQPDWRDLRVVSVTLQEGAGWSAEIFFVDIEFWSGALLERRELVVRRQASSFELVLGGDLLFQARFMKALAMHPDIPSAALFGVEESAALLGAPFLVMARVDGRAAAQSPNYNLSGWLAELPPAERRRCWRNGIEAFATLNRLTPNDGFDFLDWPECGKPGLGQYLHYLKRWYEWAAQGRQQPIADAALDYVLNVPPDAAVNVLWGDATPSNTMFRADGSVAALIDWELATLGPGEIDLAWWLYFDELFSTGFGVQRLEGLPGRAETIEIYEHAAGRQVKNMDYYDILTGLRMAIVVVRQFDRQVGLGNIAPGNKSFTDNLMTQYLARKLGMREPVLGPDFEAYLGAHIHKNLQ